MLKALNITPKLTLRFKDVRGETYKFLSEIDSLPDIIILTAEVSFGKCDYVKKN